MAVPVKMSDLFTLTASNSPQGSDAIGNSLDDFIRALSAIVRSTNALSSASIAAASTTDLGSSDAEQVAVTGSATITSFGTTPSGIKREVIFTSSGSVLTNSASIVLPSGVNITVQAGDVFQFRSLGSGAWRMCAPRTQLVVADIAGLATAIAGYLPLAGGSLTGALGGTTLSMSSTITGASSITGNSLVAAGGGITSSIGAGSGLVFADRTSGNSHALFGAANVISLFSNADTTNNTLIAINAVNANVTFQGTCTGPNFIATSDRSKKKNVKKRAARQDIADRLELVTFNWKQDNRADIGLIAQQVRDVAPEYVYTDEQGALGLDKGMLALEAVIGLAARVRALEGK